MAMTTKWDHPDRPPARDERTKIVFANFDRSLRDFMERDQREKFKTFYKAYRSYQEADDDGSTSSLSVPLIAAHVDSFYSRLVGMRPIVEVQPREPSDSLRAARQRLMIQYQWERMNMLLKAAELAKSALIYGIGWGKCTWRKESRKRLIRRAYEVPGSVAGLDLGPFQGLAQGFFDSLGGTRDQMEETIIWDDPWYDNVPVDAIYPDPDGHSIDSCRYLIHRTVMTFDELEALVRGGEMQANKAAMGRLKKALESGSLLSDEVGTTVAQEAADTFGGTGDSALNEDPTKREFILLEHWTDERVRWAVSGNPDIGLIRDQPHALGMKPFVRFTPEPLPGELIGTSKTERLYSIWLEMNALRNANMDNVMKTAHPQVMIPLGSYTDPSHVRFQAGGWFFADPTNPPQIFQYPEMKAGVYRMLNYLDNQAEQIGGTRTFRGLEGEGDTTATEANLLAQASGTAFGAMLQQMNEQPFKRLGKLIVQLNELNVTEDRYERVTGLGAPQPAQPAGAAQGASQGLQGALGGQPGVEPENEGFQLITPQELASSGSQLDVTIDVASKDPDTRVLKLRRSMEAYQALSQASQYDPAMVPLAREMGIRTAEYFDIHDARDIVKQGEAALAAQQQDQQGLAGMLGGGQPGAGQGNMSGMQGTTSEGDQLAADMGNATGLPS